jgi:hypothetical protein
MHFPPYSFISTRRLEYASKLGSPILHFKSYEILGIILNIRVWRLQIDSVLKVTARFPRQRECGTQKLLIQEYKCEACMFANLTEHSILTGYPILRCHLQHMHHIHRVTSGVTTRRCLATALHIYVVLVETLFLMKRPFY